MMMKLLGAALAAVAMIWAMSVSATGYRLAPYKDELFDYPKVLESAYGGDYVRVEYIEKRDLYGRDEVPEKKARPEYLSLGVREAERDLTLKVGRRELKYIATGKIEGAKAIVIYVHGLNGTRFLGADDGMFGGNFNRIKNLMVRNDGLYLSPGFPDLRNRGRDAAKALIKEYAAKSPGAPIFVACGSLGGGICWRLIDDPQVAGLLSGMLLLGSTNDDDRFFRSPPATGASKRVPIYIGHGTRDRIIRWKSQEAFFKRIRSTLPGYPVRFVLFDTGVHGTPVRMTDWRLVLNWMLEVGGE